MVFFDLILSKSFQIKCPLFLSQSQLPISVFLEFNFQNQFHSQSMNQTLHLEQNTVDKNPKMFKSMHEFLSFEIHIVA